MRKVWRTRDGKEIPISSMETPHIWNALAMLRRKLDEGQMPVSHACVLDVSIVKECLACMTGNPTDGVEGDIVALQTELRRRNESLAPDKKILAHHNKEFDENTGRVADKSALVLSTLVGGEELWTHSPEVCGSVCAVHRPSDHHMKTWKQNWRSDKNMMERICPHGIGHPDPDHMLYLQSLVARKEVGYTGIHGCDGCCDPPGKRKGKKRK